MSNYSKEQDDEEISSAFEEAVEEGTERLRRSWPTLLATGVVGGIDLSVGVIAMMVVHEATGSKMLGALAFTTGFIALTLAKSELFTENFFVPVAAVVAQKARIRDLARLWGGSLLMNLAGGWIIMALLLSALPNLGATANEITAIYTELGIGWRSFALAMLGGVAITVMTWMERNSDTQLAKIIAAVSTAFVLAAVPLNHAIVSSVEMFAALIGGAEFGYIDYVAMAGWAALGNTVGGLSLVTVIRLVQVGRMPIQRERGKASQERKEKGQLDRKEQVAQPSSSSSDG